MSSLYKLSISGVRSFSPKDQETIQFGAPLTLICGQNGCGKTTIIECLKYATTGDLPPNSKGGAFVNDPSVADRLLVNAEIKLGFISVDGKLMTVTRNMQLNRKRASRTQAAATNTFKTLEGQLAVISRGHKSSISTKNAELDTRVPLYLGASKAILEYVIFCHQDDSLWPLSEAGVLKKRFDEIFEASKFTKVLENLKTIRKDMATDIKLIEQSAQHAKIDKGRAQKIREKLQESTAKMEAYTEEIATLTVKIEQMEKKADALFHSNQAFQKTLSEHERLKMMIETTSVNAKRLSDSITMLPDSDEELSTMLANFTEIQSEKRDTLEALEAEYQVVESKLASLQQSYHALVRDEGSLSAKKQNYQLDLQEMEDFQREVLPKFGIEQGKLTASIKADFKHTLSTAENEYQRLLSQTKAKRAKAAEKLQDAQDSVFKEKQRLSYCEESIKTTTEKVKTLKAKLAALSENEDTLELERSQLEALRLKLEKRKQKSTVGELTSALESDNAKIFQLEQELDDLMRKISSANKLSGLHSKIDLLKESHEVKSAVLNKAVASHKAAFTKVVGLELAPKSCESVLETKIKAAQDLVNRDKSEADSLSKSIDAAESNASSIRKNVQELREKSKMHLDNILSVLEENEIPKYEKLLQELEEDYKSAVYNLNTFEVTKSYKVKAIEFAKERKCCTLCNRGMDSAELQLFVKELTNNITSVTADKLTDDVEATFKDLEELRGINVDVIQYRGIAKDLSKGAEDLQAEDRKITNLKEELVNFESELTSSSEQLESLQKLVKPVGNISRLAEEIESLDVQLSEIEDEVTSYGASMISMSELQKLQQQKNFEVKSLRQAVSDSTDERNAQQKELARLESQVKDKELLISKLELALSEAISIKHSVAESESQLILLRDDKTDIELHVADLENRLSQTKEEAAKAIEECDIQDSTSIAELTAVKEHFKTFENLESKIKHYEEHDSLLVDENSTKIAKATQDIEELNEVKKKNEAVIKGLQNEVNEAASTERNIRDNLEYRAATAELDQFHERFQELDIKNAELEKEQYQLESKKLREQISDLNSQHYGKVGEVKQIKDQILQLQNDLDTEFKDIDKQYHSEWIKLQTNLLVSNDLQTYSQALDNAIMKYHSMKMDEINRILRELWNQTYKGTDIDGIEIKCDMTKQAKGRSYNYRVVMYKRTSELDMRGRCSAGQKVLTSILIRLALAECFGTNCGMIALDEPTTNLDVENAESLANALNNIIEFRKNQKNFQLIVITHDEKFLSHINGDRYTDNFYRIERDENQHSVIKSLPIHLMQDE